MELVWSTIAVIAGLKVITERTTVNAVFFLVLAFISSAVLIITWGMDYIGLLLIIVYVGAIAILFLFVIMMINVKNEEINKIRFVPVGLLITAILIAEVGMAFIEMYPFTPVIGSIEYIINGDPSNIELVGSKLYTMEWIILSGVGLLVAMIGAIVLTLSHTEGVKRQDLFHAN